MDPLQDQLGTVYHRIRQQYNVPDFVKKADASILFDKEASHLADPWNNRYPCHTKAATWLSAAYFVDSYEQHTPEEAARIGRNFEKMATYFGILPELHELIQQRVQGVEKSAETKEIPEEFYALEIPQEDGTIKYAGVMLDEDGVARAETWLFDNREDLTYPQRHRIANRIIKRAQALRMEPSDRLQRVAGMGVNNAQDIARHMQHRSHLGAKTFTKAASSLSTQATALDQKPDVMSQDCRYRLACALDSFDKKAHLDGFRLRGEIPYPEDIVFAHLPSEFQKLAESHVSLPNGDAYAINDLNRLERSSFEEDFGTDLAKELFPGISIDNEKAASVLPTLPRPLAEQFRVHCASKGIQPVLQEKAASSIRIPDAYWKLYGQDAE